MAIAYRFVIDGTQENPPTGSAATGVGTMLFDPDSLTATYSIHLTGVTFTEPAGEATPLATAAHFHTAARGANGPVVFGQIGPAHDLNDFSRVQNADGSWSLAGRWDSADGGPGIASVAATLGATAIGADAPIYFNTHTAAAPAGLIRGQLVASADDTDNSVDGGALPDLLYGLGGADTLSGAAGDDRATGNRGDDLLRGGAGADTLMGGQGNDQLQGNLDGDFLFGNLGGDTLRGGQGNDRLNGGQDIDFLFGDLGDDTLSGDRGDDQLEGGGGADRFVLASGHDHVEDFDFAAGDRVQVATGTTFTLGEHDGAAAVLLADGSMMVLAGVAPNAITNDYVVFA